MKNNQNQKSNIPIIIGGIAMTICVACLTIFSSKSLIEKLNDNADKAYASAVDDVNRMKALAAQNQKDSNNEKECLVIDKYNVADIIEIDGKYYIRYSKINESTDETQAPITVDPSETIIHDGEEYALIDTQDPIEIDDNDDGNDVKYLGEEYVVIDIDGNMVYLVQKNDTLTSISGKVAYSVDELAEYNHIKDVNLIYEGECLRIPASDEAIQSVKDKQNSQQ